MSEEMYKSMFQDAVRSLAAIDTALGMPEDGCNSPERTITAIKLLHSVHRDDVAEIDRLRGQISGLVTIIRNLHGHLLDDRIDAALAGAADQQSAAQEGRK